MKKLMLILAAAFAMVACQTDINEVGVVGGEVDVTFEVGTPTRAYSDGESATVLQYAVYEGTTELEALTHSIAKDNAVNFKLSTKVELQLVTGNTYTVIFWAAAPNAPYSVDWETGTMTVDYSAAVCNAENRDAFYKRHTFTVKGAQTETIELRRPFAQLNIGTNDYAAAAEAGYEPVNSAVKVTNVYKTLDLWEGGVSEPVKVNFNYAQIAKGETFPVTGYQYLAMNYLLVPAEKEVVDIEFGYTETDKNAAKTRTVGSVPVQRNYRTNIYGQLLTSDVEINVEIKPEYDGEYESELVYASNAKEILSAIKVAGQTVCVKPTADGSAHLLEGKMKLAAGVSLIGVGDEPVALFNDWGSNAFAYQANFTNTTVANINFTNNLVIDAGIANGDVLFKDCVFGGDRAHQGVHFDSGNATIVFDGCTFVGRNMFGSSLTKVVFNNCTFLNKKSSLTGADKWTGVNMWGKYEFNNCVFDTEATCNVKCDGVEATFTNCRYTDNRNIEEVVNNPANHSANITIDGEPVAVVGFTTVNGYSKLWVNADKSEYTVFSAEGLIQMHDYWAANAGSNHMWGKTYSIGADIDATGHTWNSIFVIVGNNANNGFVIDGKGHTISNLAINGSLFTGTPNGSYAGTIPGVVRNLTFDNATVANNGGFGAAVIWGNTYGEVTFEDVHIVNSSITGVCNVAAFVGATTIEDGGTINPVKFIDCSVEKCTITAIGGDGCDPTGASGYVGRAFAKTSLVFEGTNTIDAATTMNSADGLVGGRVYGYTTWANGGFSGTGVCDEFVNWNGLN